MTSVYTPNTLPEIKSQNTQNQIYYPRDKAFDKPSDPEHPRTQKAPSETPQVKQYASSNSRADPNWDKRLDKNKQSKNRKEQRIGDFIIKSTLGKGTFSKVCMAEHRTTKQTFALKFIKPKSSDSNSSNDKHSLRIEREIKLLSLLYHPNIVRLYDVVQTSKFTMIVMEHNSGGELLHHIRNRGRLMERDARIFFRQIVSAVDYCHRNCIIHRDLKLENVMLDSEKRIRLIDFGFANTFYWDKQLDTFCGSPFYAAPEMVNGIKYTGPEVDIWSMGVILFFMLCGRTPFEGENLKEIYDKISKGRFIMPQFLSNSACSLLQRMLTVNPKKRITMAEIKAHAWINTDYDDLINSYIPARPAVVLDPNPHSLSKMHLYGYTQDQVITALNNADKASTPIVCIYHLVDESRRRKAAKAARKTQAQSVITSGTLLQPSINPNNSSNSVISSSPMTLVSSDNNQAADIQNGPVHQAQRAQTANFETRPCSNTNNLPVGGRKLSVYSLSQDMREIKEAEYNKYSANVDSPSILANQFGNGLRLSKNKKQSELKGNMGESFNWETNSNRDSDANLSRFSKLFQSSSKVFSKLRKSLPYMKFRKSFAFMDSEPHKLFLKKSNKSTVYTGNPIDASIQPPVPPVPTKLSLKSPVDQLKPQTSPMPRTKIRINRTNSALNTHAINNQAIPIENRRKTDFVAPKNQAALPQLPKAPLLNNWLDANTTQYTQKSNNNVLSDKRLSHVSSSMNNAPNLPNGAPRISDAYSYKPAALTPNHYNSGKPTNFQSNAENSYANPIPIARQTQDGPNALQILGFTTAKTTIVRPLPKLHEDFEKVLREQSIIFRRLNDYYYYCEDQSKAYTKNKQVDSGIKFEIIITRIHEDTYVIKFKRNKGSWWGTNKLSKKLIKELTGMEST
ncbi:hypothetical protein BB561_003036 [Smittium simulii]|uniref:non-specific serine/threonine protein kinase n=1 Tax=Smittium simulii TaxID=133385 RepID=A0A2T9YN93_9FUNG|nr:hypothetical protein BB561_003036 [Smittium simulii]